MYATVRRTTGSTRPGPTNWSRKVTGSLVPRLSKLPSVSGYHLIEAGNGVVSSIGLSDTSAQADESTRVASTWVREEKLQTPLPKPPEITACEVVVHKMRELVEARPPEAIRF
jgi:hypothetical protein